MSLFCFETFYERKSFARHFLKEVTIELYLDGYENYSLNCKDYLKNFLDKLQCKPILKTSVNVEQDRINSINPTNVGYVFDNKEEAYEIVFVEDRIYYKEKKYVGFETFIENFKTRIKNLDFIDMSLIKGVGISKVNSFIINPVENYKEALEVLNINYFSLIRSGVIKENALTNNEEYIEFENDEYMNSIRAFFRKKEEKAYEVVLGFRIRKKNLNDINMDNIGLHLADINNQHFNIFYWSLADKMKQILGEDDVRSTKEF